MSLWAGEVPLLTSQAKLSLKGLRISFSHTLSCILKSAQKMEEKITQSFGRRKSCSTEQ
jgi:hypothetical protein